MEILTSKCIKILVSLCDYDRLNQFKWYIDKDSYSCSFIDKKHWKMHRYIMINILNIDIDSTIPIDHINNNPLDNRRENLRIVTHSENSRNKKKKENCSSKYIGVSKNSNRWKVSIRHDNQRTNLFYEKEEHAAHQYNLWIDEFKIKNANKNIIDTPNDFIKHIKRKRSKNLIEKFKKIEKLYNKNNQCIFKVGKEEVIIDEKLYDDILKHTWHKRGNYYRAEINGKRHGLTNYIMKYYGTDVIDHKNNNPLDNRIENLRVITAKQNAMNRKSNKNSTSKYIGVYFYKKSNKWRANIKVNGDCIYLGTFMSEDEAAKARDIATKEHFGEFGNLNFPE